MWRKIAQRPPNWQERVGQPGDAEIAEALSAPRGELEEIRDLKVVVGLEPPPAGWMDFTIAAAGTVRADWGLSDVIDPFAIQWDDRNTPDYRITFTFHSWLEDIATNRPSILALDMEGPFGVLAAFDDDTPRSVRLLVHTSPGGVALYGRIGRHELLDAFYAPIIAYWESDELASRWNEWGRRVSDGSLEARWDLRSPLIEAAIASG